ncbi:MAG: hypothetical protein UZ21_OP11001000963 [Microgenomates bacterium OLB22]|nr:MAG: hypothetical protein UZ21_OP11001000963 [Microgenomates bacterium OLB22]
MSHEDDTVESPASNSPHTEVSSARAEGSHAPETLKNIDERRWRELMKLFRDHGSADIVLEMSKLYPDVVLEDTHAPHEKEQPDEPEHRFSQYEILERGLPEFTSESEAIESLFQFFNRVDDRTRGIDPKIGNHYIEAFLRFDTTEADLFAYAKDHDLSATGVRLFAHFLDGFFGYPMTESDVSFLIHKILVSDGTDMAKSREINWLPDRDKLSSSSKQEVLRLALLSFDSLLEIRQLVNSLGTPFTSDEGSSTEDGRHEDVLKKLHELQLLDMLGKTGYYPIHSARNAPERWQLGELLFCKEDFPKWSYEEQIAAYLLSSMRANIYTLVELSESSDVSIPQVIVDKLYANEMEESGIHKARLIDKLSIISQLKERPSADVQHEAVQQIIEESIEEGHLYMLGIHSTECFDRLIEGMSEEAVISAYEKIFQEGGKARYKGGVCEDLLRRLQFSSGVPIPSYLWQQFIFDDPGSTLLFYTLTPDYGLFEAHFQQGENQTPQEVWRIGRAYWSKEHIERKIKELSQIGGEDKDLQDTDEVRLLIALRTYAATLYPDSVESKATSACNELYTYKRLHSLHPHLAEILVTITSEDTYQAPVFCKTQSDIVDKLFKRRGDPDFALTDEENIAILYFLQGGAAFHEDAFGLYSRLLSLPLTEEQRDSVKKLFYGQYLDTEYYNLKIYLEEHSNEQGEPFTDEQLRFVYGYSLSPNKALHPLAREWIKLFPDEYLEGASLTEISSRYRAIPVSLLLPLTSMCLLHSSSGDQESFYHGLSHIDALYSHAKGKRERDELEWGLIHALGGPATDLFMKGFFERELSDNRDVLLFTETLRMIEALDVIHAENPREELDGVDTLYMERAQTLNDGLRRLLMSSKTGSVADYCLPIREHIIEDIKQLLGLGEVSDEHITNIVTHWHTIEPLLTYSRIISKEEGVPDFFKTIILHLDPPSYDRWREWRYSTEDPLVEDQLKALSEKQKAIWIVDHSLDMGHEVLPGTSVEGTISHITEMLTDAILVEGHLIPRDFEDEDLRSFQVVVAGEFGATDSDEARIEQYASQLTEETISYDRVAAFENSTRLRSFLAGLKADHSYPINTKTASLVEYVSKYLPSDKAELVKLLYKTAAEAARDSRGEASVSAESLFSSEVRVLLEAKLEELDQGLTEALASSWASRNGITSRTEAFEFVKRHRSKRQVQGAILSLCVLLTTNESDLVRDYAKGDKQTAIEKHIASLKAFFKGNTTFLQDLSNIEFAAHSFQEESGLDRHFVMLSTDDPEILMQIGRYPIGNGSCQNYDGDAQHNKGLCAYVADAHIRAICLFDVSKLSSEYQSMIREGGLNVAMKTIPRKSLLDAMVARSIIKLGTYNDAPVLYVEPCYSSLNKREGTINRFFHTFAAKVYGENMGLSLFHEGRDTSIRISETRNPGGQYEDGNTKAGLMYDAYLLPASYIPGYTPLDPEERALAKSLAEVAE